MREFAPPNRSDASSPLTAAVKPASCPACTSASIVTTAKSPDADTYWRCTNCGEIWNVSRSQKQQYGRRQWR